jgi:hypothetical protein
VSIGGLGGARHKKNSPISGKDIKYIGISIKEKKKKRKECYAEGCECISRYIFKVI